MTRRREDDQISNPRLAFALPPCGVAASAGWLGSEIDASLIEETRLPVPAFPLDLLPLFWRDWVADTARLTGAAADYVAQSLLAAVSGLCGAGVGVRIGPRWRSR